MSKGRLSALELYALMHIVHYPDQSISLTSFQEACQASRSTVSETLTRLEARDLIHRKRTQTGTIYTIKLEEFERVLWGSPKPEYRVPLNRTPAGGFPYTEQRKFVNGEPLLLIYVLLLSFTKLREAKPEPETTESTWDATLIIQKMHPLAATKCIEFLERKGVTAEWALNLWGETGIRALLEEAMQISSSVKTGFIWADFILGSREAKTVKPLTTTQPLQPERKQSESIDEMFKELLN